MQMNLRSRVWKHNYTMSEEYWRFRNGTTSNAAGEASKGYIMRPDDVSMNRPFSLGHVDAFLLIVNRHYFEIVMLMVSQSLPSSADIHQQHCGSYTREYQQSMKGTYEN